MLGAFFRHLSSIVLALILSIVIWSVATSEANPSREDYYPENVPVEISNIPDGMVIYQKSTPSVRLKIRAPTTSWAQLNSDSFHAIADLKGLTPGALHQVPIKLQVADPQVTIVSEEPDSIGIRLELLKTRTFDIHADTLDVAPPGFTSKVPTVKPTQASVSGAALLVDQVSEVVADVYLRGAKAPFDREVALVARDALGNPVQGVIVTPQTAVVSVDIEQRVGYKDVSVRAVLKGAPSPGYWVSNIAVTPSTVTIVGSADVLAKIPGYVETVPVDVTGATADVNKRVGLALPDTVTVLNNEGVNVQVSVTPILGGQTVRRRVVVQGLRSDLQAVVSPDMVDVILSGPLPTLQGLAPQDVQVVVDASGLGAGTFQLKPRVPVLPDSLKLQSIVPDSVQVTTSEIPGLTPSPTPASSVTATSTAAPTIGVSPRTQSTVTSTPAPTTTQ